MASFSRRVSADADNGTALGVFDTADLLIGVGGGSIVVRILLVNIPPLSTIQTAFLTFTARTTRGVNNCNVLMYNEAADNAAQVTSTADYNSRTLTSPGIAWSTIPGETAESTYDTPDFSANVQAVVNRPGYVLLNAMNFFLEDNGSSAGALRDFYPYSVSNPKAPLFTCTFTPPSTSSSRKKTLLGAGN